MIVDNEKTELEEYIDNLQGIVWKDLARTQYDKSRSESKTHKEAMNDALGIVIEVSNKVIKHFEE